MYKVFWKIFKERTLFMLLISRRNYKQINISQMPRRNYKQIKMESKPNVNIQTTADLLNWLSVNNHELLARCLQKLSQIETPLSHGDYPLNPCRSGWVKAHCHP